MSSTYLHFMKENGEFLFRRFSIIPRIGDTIKTDDKIYKVIDCVLEYDSDYLRKVLVIVEEK